ncbi:MAG: DUF5693 family protein [Syntrophomonadaceae bacterium]|jgi:hypothetical protein
MRINFRSGLWALLIITLVLSFSGIYIRMTNEAHNQTVNTVVDYGEFKKSAGLAHQDWDDVLQRLKDCGVKQIAVNEVTLRDLANEGKIRLTSFGEYSSLVQTYFPQTWEQTQQALGDTPVDPANLTIVTSNPQTAAFLEERLGSRFSSSELISFKTDGQSCFIIAAELDAVTIDMNENSKNKSVSKELDARLGFDEQVLNKLHDLGFEIVLRPANNTGANSSYLDEYQKYVEQYHVKTIVFAGNKLSGAPGNTEWAQDLVEKNQLTVGIIETPSQLQYVKQLGLDELMQATGYRINRVYSSSNDEFVNSPEERYYRWVRGVIDRSIRILYVVPFKDQKVSYSQNLDDTLNMIDKFHQTILDKGYTLNQPLNYLSPQIPGPLHRLMVSLSLLIAGLLYLVYLFPLKRRLITLLGAIGLSLCLAVNLLFNVDLSKVYALAAAILYPSLSGLLLLLYLRDHGDTPWWTKIPISLALVILINALGAYTVVTSLADIRYIMNVKIFSGVKVAFITPLLLFILNYYCSFVRQGNFKDKLLELLHEKPDYLVLSIFMLGVVAIYIYLGRSGNDSGIQVSSLEIKVREILENLFLARPRFKEIIIGYPSLLALVYLYHKYRLPALNLVLGLGVTMGSISMVNSFCHVFTAVSISASRTLAGLLVGVIIGFCLLIAINIGERVIKRLA